MANQNGRHSLNTAYIKLETFDRLPRAIKEVLWDSFVMTDTTIDPEDLTLPPELYAEVAREELAQHQARSCLMTYGPDHPQAGSEE
jgi:hypothetical protein